MSKSRSTLARNLSESFRCRLKWNSSTVSTICAGGTPVPDEHAPDVDEVPELQVRVLQLRDVVPGRVRVQIPRDETAEPREVVVHGLNRADVIVDYRHETPLNRGVASDDADAREAQTRGLDDDLVPARVERRHRGRERDELRVDAEQRPDEWIRVATFHHRPVERPSVETECREKRNEKGSP
eukprot:29760-Pelagococcus_subviridis.AAC.3